MFENVAIALESSQDCDLILTDMDNNACVLGWGADCVLSQDGGDYLGMTIVYSGDDSDAVVSESISIVSTTAYLVLQLTCHKANSVGTVSYSWDGVEPCGAAQPVCRDCVIRQITSE